MKKLILFALLSVSLLVACDNNEEFDDLDSNPGQSLKGTGVFTYSGYAPLADKPLPVHYHVPERVNEFTPILFVFHGGSRDALESRDKMIIKADQYNIIIVVPEFSNDQFPGGDAYNLGNVYVDGDNPTPQTLNDENVWTFSYIEPLFDEIKRLTVNNSSSYDAFGFSAGAQFLHRLLLFKPEARLGKVVPASSGWYSMPDASVDFPYGTGIAPIIQSDLNDFFGSDINVIVGENDNDPNEPGLRRNPTVDVQGTNRFDRANYFFNESNTLASNAGTPFNWTYTTIANTDHEFQPLADYAMDNIFSK